MRRFVDQVLHIALPISHPGTTIQAKQTSDLAGVRGTGQEHGISGNDRRRISRPRQGNFPAHIFRRGPLLRKSEVGTVAITPRPAPARPVFCQARQSPREHQAHEKQASTHGVFSDGVRKPEAMRSWRLPSVAPTRWKDWLPTNPRADPPGSRDLPPSCGRYCTLAGWTTQPVSLAPLPYHLKGRVGTREFSALQSPSFAHSYYRMHWLQNRSSSPLPGLINRLTCLRPDSLRSQW